MASARRLGSPRKGQEQGKAGGRLTIFRLQSHRSRPPRAIKRGEQGRQLSIRGDHGEKDLTASSRLGAKPGGRRFSASLPGEGEPGLGHGIKTQAREPSRSMGEGGAWTRFFLPASGQRGSGFRPPRETFDGRPASLWGGPCPSSPICLGRRVSPPPPQFQPRPASRTPNAGKPGAPTGNPLAPSSPRTIPSFASRRPCVPTARLANSGPQVDIAQPSPLASSRTTFLGAPWGSCHPLRPPVFCLSTAAPQGPHHLELTT